MEFIHLDVHTSFRNRYPEIPRLFRSPARINLIGEHTDYNNGFVMPAAIDKDTVFAIAPAHDDTTRIFSLNYNEEVTLDLSNVEKVQKPQWLNYLLGVIKQLQVLGHQVKPFHAVVGGNIPTGAGVSSSAALECGFVYALNAIHDFKIPTLEMATIAQWSEHNYAGVKCGIMDQFASMMGKKDQVVMLDCRSLEYHYFPISMPGYDVVLLDTQVKHSLASSEYNTRRAECEEGVQILQRHYPEVKSLRDVTLPMLQAHKDEFDPTVLLRCTFIVEENTRVQRASAHLSNGDILAFGQRMNESHHGLAKMYDVSCAELDYLAGKAQQHPAVAGARMMGGGFGGCTINIVKSGQIEEFKKTLAEEYLTTFGISLKSYVVRISDGTNELK